ncbi:MAG: tetratricopeptide repeat protein [Phycisphaerales bacterium]
MSTPSTRSFFAAARVRAASFCACIVPVIAAAHPPDQLPPAGPAFALDPATSATIEWLEARVAERPDDPIGVSSLAGALLRAARQTTRHDDFEKAAQAFIKLREIHPESTGATYGLAHARLGQHRFAEALREAQRLAFAQAESPAVMALLGDAHLAMGNTIEASLIFDRLEQQELTLDSLARVALVRDARGRHDDARTAMSEAVEAGKLLKVDASRIAWCESMLGEFALASGDLDGAEAHLRSALTGAPDMHHARFRLAEIMTRRGRIEDSERELMALAAQFPLPRYWIALGEVHLLHGEEADIKAAKELFARAEAHMAAEVERGDLGHARELVEFWLAHGGDPARAAELARRDLETVRQDAEAFEVAGWALHHAGKHEEARELLRLAIERNPGSARAFRRAAEISRALGQAVEAERLSTRARAIDPTDGRGVPR